MEDITENIASKYNGKDITENIASKYKCEYVQNEIDELINEIKVLSIIAKTEPQAAYSCFITAFKYKPSYIMSTIPDILDQLNQLDELITSEFIPAITGGIHCSYIEKNHSLQN